MRCLFGLFVFLSLFIYLIFLRGRGANETTQFDAKDNYFSKGSYLVWRHEGERGFKSERCTYVMNECEGDTKRKIEKIFYLCFALKAIQSPQIDD